MSSLARTGRKSRKKIMRGPSQIKRQNQCQSRRPDAALRPISMSFGIGLPSRRPSVPLSQAQIKRRFRSSIWQAAPKPFARGDQRNVQSDGRGLARQQLLHYRVTDPHAFLFHHAGAAYLNVMQAGEAAIREIFGALTLEDTLNPDHSRLSSRLIRKTQEILDARRSGILVTGIAERKAQWPGSVKMAFEEAVKAAQ